MQAAGASNRPLYVTLRWWPSPSGRAGPQAQWGRGQERITHCSLTPVHKGAPRLEGVRGIPKQPLVQSQTPTTRRDPGPLADTLIRFVVHVMATSLSWAEP